MRCPLCGSENRLTAKFCDECGLSLAGSAAQAPETPAPDTQAEDCGCAPSSDGGCESSEHPSVIVGDALDEVRSLRDTLPSIIDVPAVELSRGQDSAELAEGDEEVSAGPASSEIAASGSPAPSSEVASKPDAAKRALELPSVAEDARAIFPGRKADASSGAPDSDITADLSGLERLVDSSYVPPSYAGRAGDTMELPRIDSQSAPAAQSFRAGVDKAELKRQEKARKKLERERKKRERELAAQGATPLSSGDPRTMASAAEPRLPQTKSKAPRIALCLIACVIAAAAVAFATYSAELWGGKVVPDVEGSSQVDAATILESKGFAYDVVLEKSDEVEGIVLSSNPHAGSRAPEGSVVTINVSCARVIPDIVGKTQEEARRAMELEGFANVEYVPVKSNEPEGRVLSVEPAVGERGRVDTPVKIEVAQPYTVPKVEGLDTAAAVAALEEEGYIVKTAWYNTEDLAEGTAVSTDPAAGEKLDSGSTVTLYVAHNRSTELVGLTRAFFTDSPHISMKGLSYEVSEVTSVSYIGNETCTFTIVARPFETHNWMFGLGSETRYGKYETISGSITWNAENDIVATDPVMKQGS